ncbi:MAG: hypothetical protein GX772_02070, partial [Alcaligenaceae bacterium]|nr:hypothetical protein [Alcaligenaceae bacterium]
MRFSALLSLRVPHTGRMPRGQETTSDVDVLGLLLDTTASRNDDEKSARRRYACIRSGAGAGLPSYDEALERGWFRTIGERVTPAVALRDYYWRNDVHGADALHEFVWWLGEVKYHIAQPGSYASAAAFESYLSDDAASGNKPHTQTPAWVAARLWDSPQQDGDLSTWMMRWKLLDWVLFKPASVWSQESAQRFREAAFLALRNSALPGWDQVAVAASLRDYGDIRVAGATEVKPDLLGRVLDHPFNHHGSELFEARELCALMRLLILELEQVETRAVPSAMAKDLVALAMRHPDLCRELIECCLQKPQVLADLIFCPTAASLVCYLVATWHEKFRIDREFHNEAADAVQSSLLADCLEVLREHLVQGEVSAVEYARLLATLQQQDSANHKGRALLPVGLDHLSGLPVGI